MEKLFQEFVPSRFDMSSARMVHFAAKHQETFPRFPALTKKALEGEGGAGPLHGRDQFLYLGILSTARVSSQKYFIPGCVGRGLDLDLRIRPAPAPAPAAAASGNPGLGPVGI